MDLRFVLAEIEATNDAERRRMLLNVIKEYGIRIVEITDASAIERLAEAYMVAEIIPRRKLVDAYHVAISVVSGFEYLLSWNYRHLANVNKERRIRELNIKNGYPSAIRIITPLELMDYGTEDT